MAERYVQVGVTALRDPATREFLPAVPLYVRLEEGEEAPDEKLCQDLGKLLAQRMKIYMEECKKAGVAV